LRARGGCGNRGCGMVASCSGLRGQVGRFGALISVLQQI
jgi:hypothetical protein